MNDTRFRLQIALEATVDTQAWIDTYADDPASDLPEYLTVGAEHAARLHALAAPGATRVRLAGSEVLTPVTPGFTRMLVVFDVAVDPESWRNTYGTDPVRGVGAHLATELDTPRPMREEITGSVIFVPEKSGVLHGETVYRVRPQAV